MAKESKTYRLPAETISQIATLSKFFKESGAETIERAINLLDREKELEVQREYDLRMSQVKSNS
jgi:hypothetical protein